MKTISVTYANRFFSSVLRDVASGEVVTVVSRGKPVAVITAVSKEYSFKFQAHRNLVERLQVSLQLALFSQQILAPIQHARAVDGSES